MTETKVPLLYDGEVIGEAEMHHDAKGMYMTGVVFNKSAVVPLAGLSEETGEVQVEEQKYVTLDPATGMVEIDLSHRELLAFKMIELAEKCVIIAEKLMNGEEVEDDE